MVTIYHVTCPFSGERYEFNSKDALRGFVASMMAQQPDCDRTIRLYADGTLFGTMKKVSDGAVFRQTNGKTSYYVKKDGSLGNGVKKTSGKSSDRPFYRVYILGKADEDYHVDDLDAFRRKFIAKHYEDHKARRGITYVRNVRMVGFPVDRISNGKRMYVGTINISSQGVSWSPSKDVDVNIEVDPYTGKLLR